MSAIKQISELLAIKPDMAKEVISRMQENGVDIHGVNKRVLHMEAKIAAQEIGALIRKNGTQ